MDHTLINPNQLRSYGTNVQDNPMYTLLLSIVTEDKSFGMELTMQGTTVLFEKYTPKIFEVESFPHVILSWPSNFNGGNDGLYATHKFN